MEVKMFYFFIHTVRHTEVQFEMAAASPTEASHSPPPRAPRLAPVWRGAWREGVSMWDLRGRRLGEALHVVGGLAPRRRSAAPKRLGRA